MGVAVSVVAFITALLLRAQRSAGIRKKAQNQSIETTRGT
jgi:hypothetical protein